MALRARARAAFTSPALSRASIPSNPTTAAGACRAVFDRHSAAIRAGVAASADAAITAPSPTGALGRVRNGRDFDPGFAPSIATSPCTGISSTGPASLVAISCSASASSAARARARGAALWIATTPGAMPRWSTE